MGPSMSQEQSCSNDDPYDVSSLLRYDASNLMSIPLITSPSVMSMFTPGASFDRSIFALSNPAIEQRQDETAAAAASPIPPCREVVIPDPKSLRRNCKSGPKNNAAKKSTDAVPLKTMSCTCPRTKCLKLYCVCFEAGIFCSDNCKCKNCKNFDGSKQVEAARKHILEKRPHAFDGMAKNTTEGCHCKRNRCLKKYCQCFSEGVACTLHCDCVNCENTAEDYSLPPVPRGTFRHGTSAPGKPLKKPRIDRASVRRPSEKEAPAHPHLANHSRSQIRGGPSWYR